MAEPKEAPAAPLPPNSTDAHDTDPALFKDNSEFKSYKTSRFEYKDIRVFFRQHVKADQLPKSPAPLPLLVCIPGLGGSVAQFHPLLKSLTDMAPCLAIDHPGGGRSKFEQMSWEAYTTEALMELLETVIEDYRDKGAGQRVVLIGHSMGTTLAAGLASKSIPHKTSLAEYVVGLVAICPVSGPLDEAKTTLVRRLLWVPGWIFSLWRAWDAMGGPHSASVSRFVGAEAELELRMLQYRFNTQSRTPVWRRMVGGALASYQNGKATGGLPSLEVWAGLDIPVFLIAGEKDAVTPPDQADKIYKAVTTGDAAAAATEHSQPSTPGQLKSSVGNEQNEPSSPEDLPTQHTDHLTSSNKQLGHGDADLAKALHPDAHDDDDPHNAPSTPLNMTPSIPEQPSHPRKVVKSIVMHAPANHTLLYMPRSSRALAGLISDFLAAHITERYSLGWQLQYLSRDGKWDVKNLNKWAAVEPVSKTVGPRGGPLFRALKTLREADDVHSPREFAARWASSVKDVIDISLDQPVYDPRGLERAGIHYHKLPTVSKVPPRPDQVDAFIALVDRLRASRDARASVEGWEHPDEYVIGVHCHYGYNRTGYMVVCYLVERCGYALQDAIAEFKEAKPNGIRHSHFLDRLYVRYNLGAAQEDAAAPSAS